MPGRHLMIMKVEGLALEQVVRRLQAVGQTDLETVLLKRVFHPMETVSSPSTKRIESMARILEIYIEFPTIIANPRDLFFLTPLPDTEHVPNKPFYC